MQEYSFLSTQRFIVNLRLEYAYAINDRHTQSGYTLIDMMFDRFLNKKTIKKARTKNRQIFRSVSEFKFRNATVRKRESIAILLNMQVSFESS